jgi:hypothetical protein
MVPDLRTAVLEGREGRERKGCRICIRCIRMSEVQEIEREKGMCEYKNEVW